MRGLRRNRARDPPSALEVSQFAYYALTENNDTSGFVSATDAYELLLAHDIMGALDRPRGRGTRMFSLDRGC